MRRKCLLLGATAFSLLLPLTDAFAQKTEEIIVTARKRQESILTVPVVTTVLGALQIERAQIKDMYDISHKTTGLQFGTGTTEVGALVSMRGYGTTALDPGIDASVSLNLDGLQVTQGMAYSQGVFDMGQIEILKGPQALFFGKASPAGVISIRSNDPGDKLEIIARSGYEFVAQESRNELIISGPVTDEFGLRLAAMYDHFGGYFINDAVPTPGTGALDMPRRFGRTNTVFLRGTALYKGESGFSARLKLNYTRERQHGAQPGQLTSCPEGTSTYLASIGIPLPTWYSPKEDCKGNRHIAVTGMLPAAWPAMRPYDGGRPVAFTDQYFGSLELNYNISPELTLTSVTGYYRLITDITFNCFFSGAAGPTCITQKYLKRRDLTEELRLTSDFKGPLNFTLGAFYQDGGVRDYEILPGNTAFGLPPNLFDGSHNVPIKTYSGFGQVRYKVIPEVELAGGVRYTDERRSDDARTKDIFGAVTGTPGTIFTVPQPNLRSKTWSPEFTITYTPTTDLTLFGSFKQAYKSGSYNIITPAQPGDVRSFNDEKIQGGEIGMKARLADQQVRLNLAAYYYSVKGMQVGVNLPFAGGLPILVTLNAGNAKIKGIEADITYRPDAIPGLELSAMANYNRARFSKFLGAPCHGGQTFAEGCNALPAPVGTLIPTIAFTNPAVLGGAPFRYTSQDLSGTPLTRAPEFTASLGGSYEWEVAEGMGMTFGTDVQYTSKYLTGLLKRQDAYQKGFAKWNASLALNGRNDAWEVSLIANNITNKTNVNANNSANYAGGVFFPGAIKGGPGRGPSGLEELIGFVDRGRELWVRVTLRPMSF